MHITLFIVSKVKKDKDTPSGKRQTYFAKQINMQYQKSNKIKCKSLCLCSQRNQRGKLKSVREKNKHTSQTRSTCNTRWKTKQCKSHYLYSQQSQRGKWKSVRKTTKHIHKTDIWAFKTMNIWNWKKKKWKTYHAIYDKNQQRRRWKMKVSKKMTNIFRKT